VDLSAQSAAAQSAVRAAQSVVADVHALA